MRTSRFDVLSQAEVERIDAASMEILAKVGIRVEYGTARRLFGQAGAIVDESSGIVKLPEKVLRDAIAKAPAKFSLYGYDPSFRLDIGGDNIIFACLGTPTHMLDQGTGERRPVTYEDLIRHIQLVNACRYVNNTQMDVWPSDVPMTQLHSEAIKAWALYGQKSFGMGCYGYLPTLDMMRMMSIVVGGKAELQRRPRFYGICSVVSPLRMAQIQSEGLLVCAEYGQPVAVSPEGIAGATCPATLAGLLAQENANILAHIALAQIFRPGAPVLYGTVSTIANMRYGTVALGAPETGLITAASAQLARHYGLPTRSVGGTTEAKREDLQAGSERTATLLPAVLAGINFITCAGTLDSTMLESEPLLLFDDELCGTAMRLARGIEVNDETLALDVIEQVGSSGNYLAEVHTVNHYRTEHYMPWLAVREPYETWAKEGCRSALDRASQRVAEIVAKASPRTLEPQVEAEFEAYRAIVAARTLEEFYSYEIEAMQDLANL